MGDMRLKPEGIFFNGAILHPNQLIQMWKQEVKARAELKAEVERLQKLLTENWTDELTELEKALKGE